MLLKAHKQNSGLFTRMGDVTHQLTPERFGVMVVLFHHTHCISLVSAFWATPTLYVTTPLLPQSVPWLSGDSQQTMATTTRKSIKLLLSNYVSLSKCLIIIENKLHGTEILLWGVVSLLGFWFWTTESVLQLLEQKKLPPGHFIMISFLTAKAAEKRVFLMDLASSGIST